MLDILLISMSMSMSIINFIKVSTFPIIKQVTTLKGTNKCLLYTYSHMRTVRIVTSPDSFRNLMYTY